MRPVPINLRKEISEDPFMAKCCYTGETQDISWEHCWIYAGKQINERWAIVPLVRRLNTSGMLPEIKNFCRWVSIMRASKEDLEKYPKKDWAQEKKNLDRMFLKGIYVNKL